MAAMIERIKSGNPLLKKAVKPPVRLLPWCQVFINSHCGLHQTETAKKPDVMNEMAALLVSKCSAQCHYTTLPIHVCLGSFSRKE